MMDTSTADQLRERLRLTEERLRTLASVPDKPPSMLVTVRSLEKSKAAIEHELEGESELEGDSQ